jgi:S-DNA-T family DNA segregation ATPase FtsK/SpoIIIE
MPGPVITQYEFEPAPGIKINKIINLSEDLALALKANFVPRVAHIPGKSVVGIELPNMNREVVYIKDLIDSKKFKESEANLKIALGKDIRGKPYITHLETMPHLLVAGATGSGKSVCINSILVSFLYALSPKELQLLLIDPKMLELSVYNGIPHLRETVITDPKKAATALEWAVKEMEDRYNLLALKGVRNIEQYNKEIARESAAKSGADNDTEAPVPLPYLVIVIDELADLMMVASAAVENSIARLAQMARAAGIHLILATQRPSVDVLTGFIKANLPCRIAFQVSSKVDSRTILDMNGAEKLLGNGDLLLIPPGASREKRLHGAFVSESEIKLVVEFLKKTSTVQQQESIFKSFQSKPVQQVDSDPLFNDAIEIVVTSGQASISMLQRRLRVGHSRAARLIDMMEQEGIVGPFEGSKPREILIQKEELESILNGVNT